MLFVTCMIGYVAQCRSYKTESRSQKGSKTSLSLLKVGVAQNIIFDLWLPLRITGKSSGNKITSVVAVVVVGVQRLWNANVWCLLSLGLLLFLFALKLKSSNTLILKWILHYIFTLPRVEWGKLFHRLGCIFLSWETGKDINSSKEGHPMKEK